MWHEARKQEKLIRGMIVDYRRRAERRKDFYEKIKAEPTQFLQLHGRPCKIHLDPAIAMAGEGPAIMMQWQGDSNNMIDRFDVRAHLDYIPDVKFPDIPVEEMTQEERQCNYERYRILAQNVFLGINEDKFLQQLAIEEQFGVTLEEKEMQKEKLHEKRGTGAAIGYNYNDPGAQPSSSNGSEIKKTEPKEQKESDDDSDMEILDVDLSIDVNKMEPLQAHDLNAVGPQFGMAGCDLFSFLTGDADDAEQQKQLMREEKEKAMYSGRKSRRERRAHRDKKLASRVMSPPSYAAPTSVPAPTERSPSPEPSRTPSPLGNNIQFITSFGGDDEHGNTPVPTKPLYSEKVKQNLKKLYSDVARKARSKTSEEKYARPIGPRGPNSRSVSPTTLSSGSFRSKSRSKSPVFKKSRSRSPSRSPWYKTHRSRTLSRSSSSRSFDSYKRSRSRSRSRNYRTKRSITPANYSAKRNKSRSISFESNDKAPAKGAVPRYYGRRKEDKSSSELSLDSASSDSETPNTSSVGNRSNTNQNQLRSSGSSSKGASRDAMSLKEKLKKKMQAQLARQLRADKRLEAERLERESRRQARRDEEMRELAIKLRRKQREMRHKHRRSSEESDKSRSRSSSRDSGPPGTSDKKQSRSRSKSPTEPRPPVWQHEEPTTHKPKPDINHPPYDRKRYQNQDYPQKSYYPENNLRSRSPSPKDNLHVWENQRPSYPPYPEFRRRYHDDERQDYPKYDNAKSYPRNENRYEQQYESRWDSNSRHRPYGHRGGYRGHNRQGPSEEGPSNWSRDPQGYRNDDYRSDRNKVKLVDY